MGPGGAGLYRVDVASRRVSKWPGSERLQWHKCSRQGAVLGFERPAPGQNSPIAWVAANESGVWDSLGPLSLSYPDWSADGRSVIGLADTPSRRIVRFSLATRRVEIVADVGDLRLAGTAGVFWMGLAPDESPLVLRDRSTSDIYALDWEAP